MDLTTVIETRSGVRSGKPCLIGTRIAVDDSDHHRERDRAMEEAGLITWVGASEKDPRAYWQPRFE